MQDPDFSTKCPLSAPGSTVLVWIPPRPGLPGVKSQDLMAIDGSFAAPVASVEEPAGTPRGVASGTRVSFAPRGGFGNRSGRPWPPSHAAGPEFSWEVAAYSIHLPKSYRYFL